MTVIDNILDVEKHLDGIDAVIFDLDDTLYSEKDYVRSGYRAVAARFPEVPDMAEKLWAVFERGGKAIDEVLEAEGLTAYRAEAVRIYRLHEPTISLYPGVREMLARLGEKHRLGIITDGRSEGQRAKLNALGLTRIETIITDELGGIEFRKPNDIAFRIMVQRLGVPFSRAVYIGDNVTKDFIAPDRLGMHSICFANPDGLYAGK